MMKFRGIHMYRKIITLAILFLFVFTGCRHVDEGDKLTENTPDNITIKLVKLVKE